MVRPVLGGRIPARARAYIARWFSSPHIGESQQESHMKPKLVTFHFSNPLAGTTKNG